MLFFKNNKTCGKEALDVTCIYCGKKYSDRQLDGSVCPGCGHVFKLYDKNDNRWNCEYCGYRCGSNNAVCPACGHLKGDSPR